MTIDFKNDSTSYKVGKAKGAEIIKELDGFRQRFDEIKKLEKRIRAIKGMKKITREEVEDKATSMAYL